MVRAALDEVDLNQQGLVVQLFHFTQQTPHQLQRPDVVLALEVPVNRSEVPVNRRKKEKHMKYLAIEEKNHSTCK